MKQLSCSILWTALMLAIWCLFNTRVFESTRLTFPESNPAAATCRKLDSMTRYSKGPRELYRKACVSAGPVKPLPSGPGRGRPSLLVIGTMPLSLGSLGTLTLIHHSGSVAIQWPDSKPANLEYSATLE